MGKAKLSLNLKGFESLLEQINKCENADLKGIAAKALEAGADIVYPELARGIVRHHLTGKTEESQRKETKFISDTQIEVSVGFDIAKGGLPALFINYGTPRMKSDPFIRRAFDHNRKKIKETQADILNEELRRLANE
jgi:HK97 gp10 family phage protein